MRRIIVILACLAAGAALAYYGQPYVHGNADVVLIIITVFSVFAGFLVAIIAVLGDPGMIPEGSWRVAELRRDAIESRLAWHSWLFVLYLLTIGLLFSGVLLEKAPNDCRMARGGNGTGSEC